MALNRVDLPTLGRPTIPNFIFVISPFMVMDDRAFYRMTPGHFHIHIYSIMPAAALQDLSGSRRRGRWAICD
jgi:hypothetical protein